MTIGWSTGRIGRDLTNTYMSTLNIITFDKHYLLGRKMYLYNLPFMNTVFCSLTNKNKAEYLSEVVASIHVSSKQCTQYLNYLLFSQIYYCMNKVSPAVLIFFFRITRNSTAEHKDKTFRLKGHNHLTFGIQFTNSKWLVTQIEGCLKDWWIEENPSVWLFSCIGRGSLKTASSQLHLSNTVWIVSNGNFIVCYSI